MRAVSMTDSGQYLVSSISRSSHLLRLFQWSVRSITGQSDYLVSRLLPAPFLLQLSILRLFARK